MRVLVTGATGFLGGAVARRLARNGHVVRAFARESSDVQALAAAGIEVIRGELADADALARAVASCSHLIHLAAAKSGTRAHLHEVNVRGTEHVMQAAREAGVQRIVFASTLGVHGFVTARPLDEDAPVRPNTPYRLSKWHAEQVVRAEHARTGAPVVIARISAVVGCGARGWLPLVRSIAACRMRHIGDGSNAIDLVPIDDLVDGVLRCTMHPSIEGRHYVLGAGSPSTMAGFTTIIADALGVPAPRTGLPAAPFRLAQQVAALLFRRTGAASRYVHDREVLVARKQVTSARAREEIGYDPRASVDLAVRAMVQDYVQRGRIIRTGPT